MARSTISRARARTRAWLDMASAYAWDPDAIAYFQRSGTLTPNQRGRINDLAIGIKRDFGTQRLSQTFDAFWLLANETSAAALKNLAKNDHHCTAISSPTFTAFQGYAGDAAASYLKTDYIPSTDAVTFGTNAGHVSVYNRTSRTNTAAYVSVGARNTSGFTADVTIACRTGSNSIMRINDVAGTFAAPANVQGYWISNRTDASNLQRYKDAASLNTASVSVVQLPALEVYIGARNTNGTATDFSSDQHALVTIGRALSATEVRLLTTRVEKYMDALGTGIL